MHYITTAHQAELNAAAKMRLIGYVDATSTIGGSDGGIGVRSRRALAQVKWRGGVAGRPELQRLYGARGIDTSKQLLFFSVSGYSKQAVEYAKAVGIAVYANDPTGEIEKVYGPGPSKVVRPRSRVSERQMIGLLLLAGTVSTGVLMSLVWTTSR